MKTRFIPMRAVLSDMQRMTDGIDRAFQVTSGRHRSFADTFPPINIWQTDDTLFVETELPGFNLEDLSVSIEGSTVTLEGDRQIPEMKEGVWRRRERGYGKFHRKIELPRTADTASVEASLENGILLLSIPKREEAKPRRIKVVASNK
ncbi:MAG: Hsp20/alpha crystallin family protein [Planctomycetales bacterium]|nr:Hsp20/alpha crystallin family protein [Planctomycetales bacterium]